MCQLYKISTSFSQNLNQCWSHFSIIVMEMVHWKCISGARDKQESMEARGVTACLAINISDKRVAYPSVIIVSGYILFSTLTDQYIEFPALLKKCKYLTQVAMMLRGMMQPLSWRRALYSIFRPNLSLLVSLWKFNSQNFGMKWWHLCRNYGECTVLVSQAGRRHRKQRFLKYDWSTACFECKSNII